MQNNNDFKFNETGLNPVDRANDKDSDLYFTNVDSEAKDESASQQNTSTATVTKKKPKRYNPQSVKGTYLFFIIVIISSMLLSVYAVLCMNDVLAITKSSSTVTISLNEQLNDMNKAVDILADNGLIKCKNFCKLFS